MHAELPSDGGNALRGVVTYSEFLGGRWRHVVEVGASLTLQLMTQERAIAPRVWLRFPVERCLVLAEETPARE
jgi:hypothetical protein